MPLYKMTIRATRPYDSHFREADILFTAPNDNDAVSMAASIRKLFTRGAMVTDTHKVADR